MGVFVLKSSMQDVFKKTFKSHAKLWDIELKSKVKFFENFVIIINNVDLKSFNQKIHVNCEKKSTRSLLLALMKVLFIYKGLHNYKFIAYNNTNFINC